MNSRGTPAPPLLEMQSNVRQFESREDEAGWPWLEPTVYLRLGLELTFFIPGTSHFITGAVGVLTGKERMCAGTMDAGYLSWRCGLACSGRSLMRRLRGEASR